MPIQIIRQDITKVKCDAIVNSTNSRMIGLSGVDALIHKAAGIELEKECENLIPLELGFAKITKGYNLGCKYIIHTSGPIWVNGCYGEKALLKSCYLESLKLAKKNNCKSIAFPLISSGTYGYPKAKVLVQAIDTINEFLEENEMMVYVCVFDKQSYEFSKTLFNDIKDYITKSFTHDTMEICDTEYKNDAIYPNFKKSDKLEDYIKNKDKSFVLTLCDLIDEKGLTNVQCYKKANIDKKTFSKLLNNINYHPSKNTAVALAVALELSLTDTQKFLSKAGYVLSKCDKFDLIVSYFIENKKFDVSLINETLFEFDQKLLGSV